MIYVVYNDNGLLKVKSKGLARKMKITAICQFNSFYDAVDYIHSNVGKNKLR